MCGRQDLAWRRFCHAWKFAVKLRQDGVTMLFQAVSIRSSGSANQTLFQSHTFKA